MSARSGRLPRSERCSPALPPAGSGGRCPSAHRKERTAPLASGYPDARCCAWRPSWAHVTARPAPVPSRGLPRPVARSGLGAPEERQFGRCDSEDCRGTPTVRGSTSGRTARPQANPAQNVATRRTFRFGQADSCPTRPGWALRSSVRSRTRGERPGGRRRVVLAAQSQHRLVLIPVLEGCPLRAAREGRSVSSTVEAAALGATKGQLGNGHRPTTFTRPRPRHTGRKLGAPRSRRAPDAGPVRVPQSTPLQSSMSACSRDVA